MRSKGAFDALGPGAETNVGAAREPAGLEVAPGDLHGGRRLVDAQSRRRRTLGEQRAQNRARADTEIEDAERLTPPFAEGLQRRLDDRLRLRARVEHVARDLEGEAPELAPSRDF